MFWCWLLFMTWIYIAAQSNTIEIDTNQQNPHISYSNMETTDYYRVGRPYKLFCYPNESSATVRFMLEPHPRPSVELMLNHCRTNCHGKIDIIINGQTWITGFQEANWRDFGEQNFNLPSGLLHEGENTLMIKLNAESYGVYWLSNLRLDIHYVWSNLYAQCSIENGQPPVIICAAVISYWVLFSLSDYFKNATTRSAAFPMILPNDY